MSQVYNTEPSTSGHVIIKTSHGPIDVHLWCHEFPQSCRFFLQLCLDGYYDKLAFHRIMENVLVQTGHREDRGDYFESVEKQRRQQTKQKRSAHSELIPRVRFNHRGQIAWAHRVDESDGINGNDQNSLKGQFFITLDASPWLDDQHVIFGTVVGPTIFNALRIGRVECDKQGQPPAPEDGGPTIQEIIIKGHTFTDLMRTEKLPWIRLDCSKDELKKKKKKRKGKRDLNVLSFGEEEEELNQIINTRKHVSEIKSSHDVAKNNGKLQRNADQKVLERLNSNTEKKQRKDDVKAISRTENQLTQPVTQEKLDQPQEQDHKQHRLPQQKESESQENNQATGKSHQKKEKKMSALESRRLKYQNKNKKGQKKNERDQDTLQKLLQFRQKISKSS